MPSPTTTATLRAAVEPIAAYVARTPAGNQHADKLAHLVDSIADYVEEAEAADFEPPEPDWQAITLRMAAYIDTSTHRPNAIADRTRAHLDQLKPRPAALAQRMAVATITSHHLGTPDLYAALPAQ